MGLNESKYIGVYGYYADDPSTVVDLSNDEHVTCIGDEEYGVTFEKGTVTTNCTGPGKGTIRAEYNVGETEALQSQEIEVEYFDE